MPSLRQRYARGGEKYPRITTHSFRRHGGGTGDARLRHHIQCALYSKAKVEVAVQVTQRWLLVRLRNRRFFSLAALNTAIRPLLDELNMRVMRG